MILRLNDPTELCVHILQKKCTDNEISFFSLMSRDICLKNAPFSRETARER